MSTHAWRQAAPWDQAIVQWSAVIDDRDLFNDKLQEWEDFYNFNRPHGGLDGQTPYERLRAKTTENPPV